MRRYDSKILRNKIVKDPVNLDALATRFGYRIGDLVKPVSKSKRKGYRSERDAGIRCCWACNRERPINYGQGRFMDDDEGVIVLDMIDSANGRLTIVMTHEGKPGFVKSSDLERVQAADIDNKEKQ